MNYGFETRCIHGNGTDEKTHSYGSVAVPIYQAATFAHPGIGQSTGYDYTRESNPTRTELEHTMSALEGAVDTVACANGMAAVGLCLELFDRGDHILCTDDLYGGSVRMFESVGGKRVGVLLCRYCRCRSCRSRYPGEYKSTLYRDTE